MSTELTTVEFESLSGIPVKIDADTVRSTLTRGNGNVSNQEVAMFLRTCQAKKLDPFENGEVYLIKYDDKAPAQLVVGCHAYIRRADHFPEYRGFKAGITVIRGDSCEPIKKEGSCLYKALKEQLIGGWCRVKRERSNGYIDETFIEVSLEEYSTGKSNWSSKPATMIRKVAISQAFRAAFPNEYEGLYTVDEMQASGAIPGNYHIDQDSGEVIDVDVEEEQVISQEQRQALFRMAKQHLGQDANAALMNIINKYGYESTIGMPLSVFNKVIGEIMAADVSGTDNVDDDDDHVTGPENRAEQ